MKVPGIKSLTLTYLSLLIVLAFISQWNTVGFWKALVLIAVQMGLEHTIAHFIDKKPLRRPPSGLISAFIMVLIVNPLTPWWAIVAAPIGVIMAKRYVRFGKVRHLVNPTAFSMVVLSLFAGNMVSWWGVSQGMLSYILIILFGLYTVYRLRKWVIVSVYTLILGSGILLLGINPISLIVDATYLFFLTIMLIEPITTAYATKAQETLYAALAAVVTLLLGRFSTVAVDTLLAGIVVSGVICGFLFVPKRPTVYAKEVNTKEEYAPQRS